MNAGSAVWSDLSRLVPRMPSIVLVKKSKPFSLFSGSVNSVAEAAAGRPHSRESKRWALWESRTRASCSGGLALELELFH